MTTRPRSLPPARRKWGQNFLAHEALAAKIVRIFAPEPDDVVVEIGPGRGALTRHVAGQVSRLVALEIDPLLLGTLEEAFGERAGFELRHADALEIDWDALAAELGGRVRVLGNLPYNVGTPIVRRLLACDAVQDMQVLLQLEVVERFLAREGSKSYGPLAIVAALRARGAKKAILEPGCFRPAPKVRSALLHLAPREDAALPAVEIPTLESWLHRGFAQRRKTLATNLKPWRESVRRFLAEEGLPEDARAEVLSPEGWLRLARKLEAETS